MSVTYSSIGWNRQKKIYDLAIVAGVALYLGLFILVGLYWHPFVTIETLLIRALGTCAFLLLHVVLVIGPLCRLSPRFLPLLYNRRHLGVVTFLVALAHGTFSVVQFHALGDVNPLVSVLAGNTRYSSLSDFPFQTLGLAALVILFLMAATSHDFWLANLGASAWKRLHMMVYLAYGLLVAHVTLGALQAETSLLLTGAMGFGIAMVITLHLSAAWRERPNDRPAESQASDDQFIDVCSASEITEKRARIITLAGERVAVFRYDGRVSAISNVCQHQNGPLGEGKIIDGCITCPWHGFQYLPATGASPPPFIERVPTFRVRIVGDRVQVDPRPNAAGTYVEPAIISSG